MPRVQFWQGEKKNERKKYTQALKSQLISVLRQQ